MSSPFRGVSRRDPDPPLVEEDEDLAQMKQMVPPRVGEGRYLAVLAGVVTLLVGFSGALRSRRIYDTPPATMGTYVGVVAIAAAAAAIGFVLGTLIARWRRWRALRNAILVDELCAPDREMEQGRPGSSP